MTDIKQAPRGAISRGDRNDLIALAKQKERLRLAALKAWKGDKAVELQTQMDREYRMTDFPDIATVRAQALEAERRLQVALTAACDVRGIPANFRPKVELKWHPGGWSRYDNNKEKVRAAGMRHIDAAFDRAKAQAQQESVNAVAAILAEAIDGPSALTLLAKIDVAGIDLQEVPSLSDVNNEVHGFLLPDPKA